MVVHILAPDDHVFSLNRVTARIGFLAMGADVRMFASEDFDEIDLKHDDIVVGGIGFAQRGMRRLGLHVPELESVPAPLEEFAGRRIWRSTMRDLRSRVEGGDVIFAKPRPDRLKAFNGQLFSSFRDLIPTAHVPDDEPVDCAEPITLLSEHRCFVLRGDPIDLRPYKGDALVLPDPDVIRRSIAAYADAPMGCAIDYGVTHDGKTVVVEINDGYAVGCYGMAPINYAKLIAARWDEIKVSNPLD